MQNVNRKFKIWGATSVSAVFCCGSFHVFYCGKCTGCKRKQVFVTINGDSYYINEDGSKQKGWLELEGKKYYFNTKTGVQVKGVGY